MSEDKATRGRDPGKEADVTVWTWFAERFGLPTPVQRAAWPLVEAGSHLLICAPTGTGKTLAAILPILAAAVSTARAERCVYLTPQKALCADLAKNLRQYADAIGLPANWVDVRTGDTPASRRRQIMARPPGLLLTTPESLALMLAHPRHAALLRDTRWVVVDEVHSFLANKRGAELSITLERLADAAARDPQRLGLSATVAPLARARAWLGGVGRTVELVHHHDHRGWDLEIRHLPAGNTPGNYFRVLLEDLVPRLLASGTTLIFTNVRSLAERLTWSLRRRLPDLAEHIAVHHGALARAERERVEAALKAGTLRVVVSSTTLELGVDIGSVDQVVLIHPPSGTARLLQRLGRAGHRPDGQRRGLIYTTRPEELLEVIASQAAGQDQLLEPFSIPSAPLDVLCQQLVGWGVAQRPLVRRVWDITRRAWPYRDLALSDLVDCLALLTDDPGTARLQIRDQRLCCASNRVARAYRTNVGTINEEPTRTVVQAGDGQLVGRLPEHFGERLRAGDRFLLEGRVYAVTAQTAAQVSVAPADGLPSYPHWQAGLWELPQPLAERLWWLRQRLGETLLDGPSAVLDLLANEFKVTGDPAEELLVWLQEQEQVSEIPGAGGLVEVCRAEQDAAQIVALHLPLTRRPAEALGLLLAQRAGRHWHASVLPGCLGCLLVVPATARITASALRDWLRPTDLGRDLTRAMVETDWLQKRFQTIAQNALVLLRQPLEGQRPKVGGRHWAGRRLFQWYRAYQPRHPLLRQTLREVVEEECCREVIQATLERWQREPLRVRWLREPSPFASAWLPSPATAPPTALDDLLPELAAHAARAS